MLSKTFAHFIKFQNKAYRLLRIDGSVLILPSSLLEELSALPSSVASPHGALEKDLLGAHTGMNVILETRMHHTIVQRKMTPRLPTLTPFLEQELVSAMDEHFPKCEEWTKFQPYQVFAKLAARLAARALVGPELCRNPAWLDISVNYTESCKVSTSLLSKASELIPKKCSELSFYCAFFPNGPVIFFDTHCPRIGRGKNICEERK